MDIAGITMPITKHNFIVHDVKELASTVRLAFEIANSSRPGPVLIDIPKDITAAVCEYEKLPKFEKRLLPSVKESAMKQAIAAIRRAKRPLIYAGGGVIAANACEELLAYSRKTQTPICCSAMGLSSVPYDYELYLGMIGMHGTPVSNYASLNADLVIAIGARFSDRVAGNRKKFANAAEIIHIDIDASEISKNVKSDIAIVGDAKEVLQALIQKVEEEHHSEWRQTLLDFRIKIGLPKPKEGNKVDPRDFIYTLHKLLGEDAIIVTDVGQHQMITAQYYQFSKPRSFISSCGLGTMGYGLGAAIGAKCAHPDRPVVLITGDGSFHMNMNEMAVAVSQNLPIIVLVFNNTVLGMVRQWQTLFYGKRYSETSIMRQTDFVKLAEAFGAKGFRIKERDEIEPIINAALASKRPCIIDCLIDPDDCVYPIIPPGKNADEIIYGN